MIVNNTLDLKQIRRDIKTEGFNYRIKKYSDFDYLEFYHIETKKVYPSIFTKENLIFWHYIIQYEKRLNNG